MLRYLCQVHPRPLLAAFLSAVFAAALFAVVNTLQVEVAADHMVAYTRQVFNAAAADKYYGVFLKIVAFAANVSPDFVAVTEADAGHLAQGRVRFLWCFGGHFNADAALKGRLFFVVAGL